MYTIVIINNSSLHVENVSKGQFILGNSFILARQYYLGKIAQWNRKVTIKTCSTVSEIDAVQIAQCHAETDSTHFNASYSRLFSLVVNFPKFHKFNDLTPWENLFWTAI